MCHCPGVSWFPALYPREFAEAAKWREHVSEPRVVQAAALQGVGLASLLSLYISLEEEGV